MTDFDRFLHLRGVDIMCSACQGLGTRVYSSTSTWRGGMGGAALTHDVCDVCWGTGDRYRHGPNLRKMEAERSDWGKDQALSYLSRRLGITLPRLRRRYEVLAELADAQSRRRRLPDGEDPFWWRRDWEAVASCLRSIAGNDGGHHEA